MAATQSYFKVRESAAGELFSLTPGELLRVDGPVPALLTSYARSGAVERLTGPPSPGLDYRIVTETTFRNPPPEPAAEPYIELRELMRRLDWTYPELERARARFGFPKPAATRTAPVETDADFDKPAMSLYRWSDVTAWLREQRAMFAELWRDARLDD